MKNCLKRVISLMLAVMLVVGTIPVMAMPDYAQDSEGCNHTHDAACGYGEGAPCGHECGEACAENCVHTGHDEACGYTAAAPCTHAHGEACGGAGESAQTDIIPEDGAAASGEDADSSVIGEDADSSVIGESLSVEPLSTGESFSFEVAVGAGDIFYIPTSGQSGTGTSGTKNTYNWNINWGDGGAIESKNGTGGITNAGIKHTYTAANTYTITITPAGSTDRWLAAFGFYRGTNGANVQTNKDKVTKVISPLTPLMTRSQAQITGNTAMHYEWCDTFYGCTNLTMGENFTFSPEWNTITTVGDYFADDMFRKCMGDAFTMNNVFNLPQNITSVGKNFAAFMFYGCSGASFNMNGVFNLPPNISGDVGNSFATYLFASCEGVRFTMNNVFNLPPNISGTVGDFFVEYMFYCCDGTAFKMNNVFNLPPNITTVGNRFAYYMFYCCTGTNFTMNSVFNLPQGITTVGDAFTSGMFYGCTGGGFKVNGVFKLPKLDPENLNKTSVLNNIFRNLTTPQNRTATSIINGNQPPDSNKNTFYKATGFSDFSSIAINWGGEGKTVTEVIVTPGTASVDKGETKQFSAAVTVTNNAAKTVTWAVNSQNSTISSTGLLTVGANETAATLTVTATSTLDSTKYGTAVVTVTTPFTSEEFFSFQVTVGANDTFYIPTSGRSGTAAAGEDNAYNWNINWGDGKSTVGAEGTSATASDGISHTYTNPGIYTITITPAVSDDRWLAAFGFSNNTTATSGANTQANRDKVTEVSSPLTPLMTRSAAQKNNGNLYYEWGNTFYGCKNLTMGENFTFSEEWDDITTLGPNFAYSMFNGCSGNTFTMGANFNLPKNITTVGSGFAQYMFKGCSGSAFTMGANFNLPTEITAVGNSFAASMFEGCSGASFEMNNGFNIPQGITGTVGSHFSALMFSGCYGASFNMNDGFNLPENIGNTVGNNFAANMFYNCKGDDFIMNSVFNMPQDITTVGSHFAALMFYGCSGASFKMNNEFNLPPSISGTAGDYFAAQMFFNCYGNGFEVNSAFIFPSLNETDLNKSNVFYQTFYGVKAGQNRTAASIINDNDTPSSSRGTFTGATGFIDRPSIATSWGGLGQTVTAVAVNSNSASVHKGGTQQFTAAVTVTGSASKAVTWAVSGNISNDTTISSTGKLTVDLNETATSLTVTATSTFDTAQHGTATITVIKATGGAVSAKPTVSGTPTLDSIAVNPVTAVATGQAVEYAISTESGSVPAAGWQVNTTFTDLTPNTTYYVYARTKADDTYTAGAAKVSDAIKTAPPTYLLTVSGGTIDGGSEVSGDYTENAVVSITANSPDTGMVFDTWTTDNGGTFASPSSAETTFTMPAWPVTVTATYTNATYTITYSGLDGATHSNLGTYTYGAGVTSFAAPTARDGFTFLGWYDDETEGNKVTTISNTDTGDKTLWAYWQAWPNLISIATPAPITGVSHGAAKTALALGLPATVVITTSGGSTTADLVWEVASCDYNPAKTAAQTFAITGAVTLPDRTTNTTGIPLSTTISVTVDKKPHTHDYGNEWESDDDNHWHECVCGEKTGIVGHVEDDGVVTTAPTESETGIRTYSCNVCGKTLRTESIPMLIPEHTHDYGNEWESDDDNHWRECSCGETKDTAAHTLGDWIVDQAPTDTQSGSQHKECTVCGKALRTETIPELAPGHTHDYGSEWESNADNHWHECACGEKMDIAAHTPGGWMIDQAPTDTQSGSQHKECTVCDYVTAAQTIPATGGDDSDDGDDTGGGSDDGATGSDDSDDDDGTDSGDTASDRPDSGTGAQEKPTIEISEVSVYALAGLEQYMTAAANVEDAFSHSVEVKLTDDQAAVDAFAFLLGSDNGRMIAVDISLYIKGTNQKVQPKEGYTVTISMPLPKELWDVRAIVQVGHLADGVVNILPSTLVWENEMWNIVFEASQFSPYALLVGVEVSEQEGGDGIDSPQTDDSTDSPQTDDSTDSPQTDDSIDSPQTSDSIDSPQTDDSIDNPQTGDSGLHPLWWLWILIPAAVLTICNGVIIWRRRRASEG